VEGFLKVLKGLCLKQTRKVQIFQKRVWYLGHTLSPDRMTTDLKGQEVEKCWMQPKEKHELRSLLNLCIYNRRFTV
jgi:hypothetical protein